MELNCDWRTFQSLFNPQRRSAAGAGYSVLQPIYLVLDGELILTAFSDQEDLSDWVGASVSDIRSQTSHRELICFQRTSLEGWVQDSLTQGRFFDQVDVLRSKAIQTLPGRVRKSPAIRGPHRHFLLRGLKSWWSKLLPSAYGVFIRVSGRNGSSTEQDFVLIVRRGVFDAFHQPDLSSLPLERRRQMPEVLRTLESRYYVPIQGVVVSQAEWNDWADLSSGRTASSRAPAPGTASEASVSGVGGGDPWKAVWRSIRLGRTQLYPPRVGVRALIALRSWLGI